MCAMQVSEDHFFGQFDRYPEGRPRFEAVAVHAAMLRNKLEEETERRKQYMQDVLDVLREASPLTALALDIADDLASEKPDR